jgi:hypothetical protein
MPIVDRRFDQSRHFLKKTGQLVMKHYKTYVIKHNLSPVEHVSILHNPHNNISPDKFLVLKTMAIR